MSGDPRNIQALDNMQTVSFNATQTDPKRQSIGATVRPIANEQITWCGYLLHNNDASNAVWVQVFYKPAGQVVLGTTAPDFTIKLGSGESIAWDFLNPVRQGTGLSIAGTTTETGSTGPSTAASGSFLVKTRSGQSV